MRPATVLSDLQSCSRRASAGVLRSQQCQPGRSGRMARVVPATAPPSSPTSSGSTVQSSISTDPTGQLRPGNAQVAVQQPNQKSHAAAQPVQSHAIPTAVPGIATSTNTSPVVIAPTMAASPPSSPSTLAPDSSRTTASHSSTLGSSPSSPPSAAPASPFASSPQFTSPPASTQPLSDSRVVQPSSTATTAMAGKADVGTVLPLSTAQGSNNLGSSISVSNGRSNGSAASVPGSRSPSPLPGASASANRINTGSGFKSASQGQQPSSSGGGSGSNATIVMELDIGPANGDAAATATGTTAAVATTIGSPSYGKQPGTGTPTPSVVSTTSGPAVPPSPPPQAGGGAAAPASVPPAAGVSSSPGAQAANSPLGAPHGQSSPVAAAPTSGTPAAMQQQPAVVAQAASSAATSPSPRGVVPAVAGTYLSAGNPTVAAAATAAPASTATASDNNGANVTSSGPASAAVPPSPSSSSSSSPAGSAGVTAPNPSFTTTAGAAAGAGATLTPATASAAAPPPAVPSPSSSSSSSSPPSAAAATINSASSGFQLRPIHVVIFAAIFLGGALFAALTLQFTADLDFQAAATTVARRVARSVAFRQLCVIACAICLVRFGLNNVLRALAKFSSNPVQWDKSKVYYILKEVYQPLELLLFIAAICTIADSFVPQLIAVPRSTVSTVVRSTLSVSFIIGAAVVVFNLKSRFCKENAWQSEMNGDVTAQRRWEAYDKLGTFVIYTITFVLGIQALGLEVTSVLAIGGIGGLAIGLAGREICENILNGFLIMSTSPFEVGDEVHFFHANKVVEGMVLDIGWYRTTIRSYEREVFVIPNAVFSKNIVLNITRKNREWRFFEMICVRVQDVHKVNTIIQDIRRIVRNDQRIITKLHRRIFLDKLTHEDCRIYVSFYVEAQNRESFMAVKQDLLLAFVDCVERNGAKLAVPRTTVQMEPEVVEALSPMLGAAAAMAAAKVTMDVQAAGNAAAAAAAARALTDGRTITAEVTAVPSTSSTATVTAGLAGGTTATSGKAAAGSPGSPGKSMGGNAAVVAATVADATTASTTGGGGVVTASPPLQGSSKGEGTGLTWILSKLAHVLFET